MGIEGSRWQEIEISQDCDLLPLPATAGMDPPRHKKSFLVPMVCHNGDGGGQDLSVVGIAGASVVGIAGASAVRSWSTFHESQETEGCGESGWSS